MKLAVIALVVVAVALSLAVYSRLPAAVPVHWNTAGQIDNYVSRAVGAFLLPGIMLILGGVFAVLPAISPSGFDIERKSRPYTATVTAVLLFLLGVHVYILLAALNMARSITTFVPILVGALFIVIGNYLPKMRRNFFVGIRTPWTLADEDVWFRTHRLGGILFVMCGALLMAAGPFFRGRAMEALLITTLIVVAVVPVVYSFAIYRRPRDKEEMS
jgi:uncharacterized membrane protein